MKKLPELWIGLAVGIMTFEFLFKMPQGILNVLLSILWNMACVLVAYAMSAIIKRCRKQK